MENLLTVQQVAAYLQLSRTTIWRWCSEGQLPAIKIGRGWRIQRKDLDRYIESSSNSPQHRAVAPHSSTAGTEGGHALESVET